MNKQDLHQSIIEAVKERLDIVDVISDYVILKKRGREFVGICPFHDDKTPSLTVSPTKKLYHCFSCGAGGNGIKFLMEFQQRNFRDTVLHLAQKYQLSVEINSSDPQTSQREQLYEILTLASQWFNSQLYKPTGAKALTYLQKERNLDNEIINNFSLGYAPARWDALFQYLHETKHFTLEVLKKSGLVKPRSSGIGLYDRFRDRIIIPIRDYQGRTIAFGGRSLNGNNPKYLNSPETEVFQKSKCLFGIDRAYHSISKCDEAVVVEGYFDVISLHRVGITNVVASLGTTLNKQQVMQLCHYTEHKRITLNFDTDKAGFQATQRAINEVEGLALKGQVELRVLHLSETKDPDDFTNNHSSSEYQILLDKAPLWLDWQITQILEDKDLNETKQFQQVISAVVPLLGKLSQPTLRSHYIKKVAELLSGGQSRFALRLEEDLHRQIEKGNHNSLDMSTYHGHSREFKIQELAEEEILRIYIHCSSSREGIRHELFENQNINFNVPSHSFIWKVIERVQSDYLKTHLLKDSASIESSKLTNLDLVNLLSNQLIPENNSDINTKLVQLLNPNEVQLVALTQPLLQLRGAIAIIEKQKSLKRCQYLLDAWSNQQLQTLEDCIGILIEQESAKLPGPVNMESKIDSMFFMLNAHTIRFQELYYREREYISSLDRQRWTNLVV
ncbi:MAG TPA: DNA primase [Prochlorococcaceae cyanobacterium AMR_MDS_5431]|nr:DNA primase [Prochlorococcaceae cyanobacterium AMR_MDS_5431]